MRMFVYATLSRIFPRSFAAKILCVALAGMALPAAVTAMLVLQSAGASVAPGRLLVGLGLSIAISALVTSVLLYGLLAPLRLVRDTLVTRESIDSPYLLPQGFLDEAGQVMELTDQLLSGMQAEIRLSRTAADTDPLTGLLNRRGFDRHRPACQTASIIFIDLDQFKSVNDRLGHDAGDVVLRETADLLRMTLREGELVARFGGEEFVVFLPDAEIGEAMRVAERIRSSAEARLATPLGPVTVSAGVSQMERGMSFAAALSRADQAVYAAKAAGRNCVYRAAEPRTVKRPAAPAATIIAAAE